MTDPHRDITDTSRPRPVRVAAYLGALAQAGLVIAALAWDLRPDLVAAILGLILVGQLGGWLLVEHRVTPTSDPRTDTGVALVPATTGR